MLYLNIVTNMNDSSASINTAVRHPRVPEEITAPWLFGVLNLKVRSVVITKSLHTTASKIFCTVMYEDDGAADGPRPKHICIKGGFCPEQLAVYPLLPKLYEREIDFFSKIAPTLHMDLPRIWYADHGILIMDDLTHAGCVFADPLDSWPVERVKAGVEQLAAMHAGTWNIRQENYPYITPDYEQLFLGLMPNYIERINAEDGPLIPGYLRDHKRVTAAVQKYCRTRNPRFRCLVHGDPHIGNTYLTRDGQVRFVDFQVVYISSALHDLAYFVGGALSIEDRRAHEGEVIDHYLHSLAYHGGPRLPRDEEVMAEYAHSFMSGLGWATVPYWMQSMETVHAMTKRYMAAIQDHKTIELLEALPEVAK